MTTELAPQALRTVAPGDAIPNDFVVPYYLDDLKRRISVVPDPSLIEMNTVPPSPGERLGRHARADASVETAAKNPGARVDLDAVRAALREHAARRPDSRAGGPRVSERSRSADAS